MRVGTDNTNTAFAELVSADTHFDSFTPDRIAAISSRLSYHARATRLRERQVAATLIQRAVPMRSASHVISAQDTTHPWTHPETRPGNSRHSTPLNSAYLQRVKPVMDRQ